MLKLFMFLLRRLFGALTQPGDGVGAAGADSYDKANRKALKRLERWNDFDKYK